MRPGQFALQLGPRRCRHARLETCKVRDVIRCRHPPAANLVKVRVRRGRPSRRRRGRGIRRRTKWRNRSHMLARRTRITPVLLLPSAKAWIRQCSSYHLKQPRCSCAHCCSLAKTGCAASTIRAAWSSSRWRTASSSRFETGAGAVPRLGGASLHWLPDREVSRLRLETQAHREKDSPGSLGPAGPPLEAPLARTQSL